VLLAVVTWSALVGGTGSVSKTKIPLGTVVGKIEDYKGKQYTSFRGIRYAQPPVGKLRFLPPEPFNEAWQEDLVSYRRTGSRKLNKILPNIWKK